jgi:hypothetical protein
MKKVVADAGQVGAMKRTDLAKEGFEKALQHARTSGDGFQISERPSRWFAGGSENMEASEILEKAGMNCLSRSVTSVQLHGSLVS